MSIILTVVRADRGEAGDCGVEAEVVQAAPEVYTVICNGNASWPTTMGPAILHACPEEPDVQIEPGDTWSSEESAVEFADMHIRAHEERG